MAVPSPLAGFLELLKGTSQIATCSSTQLSQLLKETAQEGELNSLEALGVCLLDIVAEARQGQVQAAGEVGV
jgi:hypothetical protein